MVLGAALLCAALTLFTMNERENTQAQEVAEEVLPQLVEQIEEITLQETEPDLTEDLLIPEELLTEEQVKMPEVEIKGNRYIGYLSMPTLGLKLPIMSSWSYPKLKISPCRYSGSIRGKDLVLLAHNYKSHFGPIRRLKTGDPVTFTDMEGNVTRFAVAGRDVLPPTAVEEITGSGFPLTLFTCTYGGKSRVTVYCDLIEE